MRSRTSKPAIFNVLGVGVLVAVLAAPAFAGFSGTDLFIPFVGRGAGVFPSNWFSTVWIYNPNGTSVSVSIYFLERTKNNTAAVPVVVQINAGETKEFDNIVETTFGKLAYGALRITCDSKVVAEARVYSNASAVAPLNQSFGQDLAGVPASFAIGTGESTEILGGYQTLPTGTSQARFNIGFVETTGHSVTVRWTVKNAAGVEQAHFDKSASALSQAQGAFSDYFPGVSLANARLTASVTVGTGKVIAYGSFITNGSQDPTTFEMQYPDSLLFHLTGLFHGAVWSTDGLVIEGGLEVELSGAGVVSYSASAGLQCGANLYTLDFADTPASPLAIDGGGNFTATLTIGYEDGGATVFTTTWTFAGNRDTDGILTGTLRSDTSGGTGDWAACNGTNVLRNWRAGWTKDPV